VKALYKISKQREDCYAKIMDCRKELAMYEAALDSITKLALGLGADVKEYSSHNLDLQEGLLSSLKKQEKLDAEVARLKSRRHKWVSFGAFGGYSIDLKPIFGAGAMVNLFSL